MRMRLLLLTALLAVLGGCVPVSSDAGPRTQVEQLTRPVGYYPDQAGARWEYLPDNAPVDDPRVIQLVEGPRVVNGRTLISHLTRGAGAEERKFRSIGPDGVELHMRSVPGAQTTFEPPMLEFPAQLRRGASWSGRTTASTLFPAARPEQRLEVQDIRYSYTVVDRRQVRVPAGAFDVYVINQVTELLEDGRTVSSETRELWYSPYVGEIRTVGGFYLVELNFTPTYP